MRYTRFPGDTVKYSVREVVCAHLPKYRSAAADTAVMT
jgi:hypothetical protein